VSGWGLSPWGLGMWGLGTLTALSIESCRAASLRSVRVVLSMPPLAGSTIVEGDALNPNTWYIQDLQTSEFLTVTCVAQISSTEFEVFTIERVPSYPYELRIGSSTLVTASGVLISSPSSCDAPGLAYTPPHVEVTQLLDLKNPQFPLNDQPGGTLRVDASGDYEVHTGIDVLRKLVIRRLTTMPGAFFHMPDYGIGLRVKEPLVTPDLVKLRTEIRQQLLKEPEFDAVDVGLSLSADGVLHITVRARLSKLNQEVVIPVAVPTRLVTL